MDVVLILTNMFAKCITWYFKYVCPCFSQLRVQALPLVFLPIAFLDVVILGFDVVNKVQF